MVREHDHPLNETGYKQALQLQLAIRRALADPPKDGQEPTTAQSLGLAGAFWASPLTRAVQTAITALEPILSQPGNMLELKLNAREKKNFGGLDSIGRVCGNECYKRALGDSTPPTPPPSRGKSARAPTALGAGGARQGAVEWRAAAARCSASG